MVAMALNQVKDKLSAVIAEIAATGESVEVTSHGKVVAVISRPSTRVVLGLGRGTMDPVSSLDDLAWSEDEIEAMIGQPVFPE